MSKRLGVIIVAIMCGVGSAQAGMTVYDLSDVVRLRLEDISFFALLLLIAACGVRLQWNYLARDVKWMPRLSWVKAFSLTGLLGLLMLLILIMIAGARELLTPGAWYRQGVHYRPNDAGSLESRQQSIENLRSALLQYASSHDKRFPPHDYVPEIPSRLWEASDSARTRFIYVGGLSLTQSNAMLACEPLNFGEERFVLFSDGRVQRLKTARIHELMGVEKKL